MKSNKKAFRYSVNSSVIIVGAIIITLLLNAILVTLNDRFSLEIDFTEDGIYELTDTSKEILDKIDQDVQILMFTNGTESEQVSTIKNVLSKYTQHNSKISVQEIDLVKDPSALAPYQTMIEADKFTLGSLVLKCGDKSEFVSSANFITTDGQSNIERSVTSKLTNFVDGMSLSAITFTTGHGETKASSTETALETDAYQTVTLDTLTEDFPADGNSMVIINAPQNDFSAEEINKLDAYLDRGGNVMIGFDPAITKKLDRLESYLADDWGIVRNNNIVIDQKQMLSGTQYSMVEFDEHDIAKPVAEGQKKVVSGLSNSFEIAADLPQSVEVKTVLKSSPEATETTVEALSSGSQLDNAKNGVFNLMLAATRENYEMDSNETHTGHLVVYGSETMFDGMLLEARFANEDIFLNTVNWMKDSGSGITVRAKLMPGGSLTITQGQFWVWFAILVVVVPVGLLAAGLVIWLRRRYK